MQIQVNLSDEQVKSLEHDLLDLNDWVQKAVEGKISKCKDRMIQQWMPKLMADPDIVNIPADESQMIKMIVNHKNYKNRSLKEEEEKN
jgi:site-specific recombinase XerD